MRRTWTWTFDLPPDRLWPVLADTDRFNEAMGLPPYTLEQTPQPNGTVLRRGRGKTAGFNLEWEAKPYEWIGAGRVTTEGPVPRIRPRIASRARRKRGPARPLPTRVGAVDSGRPRLRRATG